MTMLRISVKRPSDFVEFPGEAIFQGIHNRIEDQVRIYPDHPALRTPSVSYTYAEMNARANSIAMRTLSAAGKKLAQAALLLANSPEVIIAILGALKAHKCYVPLDPNFPEERLRIMFDDAEPSVLITDDEHLPLAKKLSAAVPIVNISKIPVEPDAPNPDIPLDQMDRAYILFTSGSTGRPKGIAFCHRNLLHTTMCLVNNLRFSPSDRITWLHSASFAASVVDIYCCLTAGGTLYPWDVKTQGFIGLAEWLTDEKVTTLQWIPSAFRQFLRTVQDEFIFESVRLVVMASEPLTIREVELFRRHFRPGSYLANQLGTSESYNYCLYPIDHQIPIDSANVPGGYAVSDERRVLILDEDRRVLPQGEVGEIGIQSEYMSLGYWHDEELTSSKFVTVNANSAPVYLTGDLGTLKADGCLLHLGRKDFQVKIRGYRVELAEVDHVLSSAPGIGDAAAWVVRNRLDQDQLVAYVVLRDGCQLDQALVGKHVASRVPDYMVPRHYVVLDRLPTLPTGKIDRKGLPNPFSSESAADILPAAGELLKEEVRALFSEVLQTPTITTGTDFMEAGGDSLLLAVLLKGIHQRFGIQLDTRLLPTSLTPDWLSEQLARARAGQTDMPDGISAPVATRGMKSLVTRKAQPARAHTQNLIIITAGSLAREVFTWATHAIAAGAPWRIKGFLDTRPDALKDNVCAAGVIGSPDTYEMEENDVFIGGIGNPHDKLRYYSPIVAQGGRFTNVIHPTACIGPGVRLGAGIVLAPYTVLTTDVTIGDHVAIGTFSNLGHDVVIGDWCQISSHCGVNGHANVGDGAFLGSHACVLPGLKVGKSAFVGAGSIVIRDVAPQTKVFGNPAAEIAKVAAVI